MSLTALLAPLLSLGLFNYSDDIIAWIRNNYCVLGFLLWGLTLLVFLVYALRNRKEKNGEFKKEIIPELEDTNEIITETVIPLDSPRIESI